MQKFTLVGVIQRAVIETYNTQIVAETAEDAQDTLYEILSEFPDSELAAERLVCVRRDGSRPNSIVVELVSSETEEVFNDDDTDPTPA